MNQLSPANPLTLADFEYFSQEKTTHDTALIGKKFLGNGGKQISSLTLQRSSGGTASVVTDFKKALAQKYGQDVADFAFSSEIEKKALSQGLNKKTITTVLNKAITLTNSAFKSDFFEYQKVFDSKQEVIKRHLQNTEGASLVKAQTKYTEIKNTWRDCISTFYSLSPNATEATIATLQRHFTQEIQAIDQLAREIITNNAERIIQQDQGVSAEEAQEVIRLTTGHLGEELTLHLLGCLPDHEELARTINSILQEATEQPPQQPFSSLSSDRAAATDAIATYTDSLSLETFYQNHPLIKEFVENLNLIPEQLKEKTERLHEALLPFTSFDATLPLNCSFYLSSESNTITIYSPQAALPPPSVEEQKRAAQQFFSTLKAFYGNRFIDTLFQPETQEQPLTIEQIQTVFRTLHETIPLICDALKKNPILITSHYILTLAYNEEAAIEAKANYEQLGAEGNTFLRTLREAGLCGIVFSGTKIGLAIASIAPPTAPCIAIAMIAAAVDGYLVGRFISSEEGRSRDIQHEAGEISAASTVGSAAGLIVQRTLQASINAYIPEVVSSTVAEYAGGYLALSLLHAAQTGAHTATADLSELAESDIFLEPRIARFFGLQAYLDRLLENIGTIGGLMSPSQPLEG